MRVKVPIWRTSPTQAVTIDPAATVGAQIGVNLLLADGTLATTAKLAALFGAGTGGGDTLTTTDDLPEGQWHLWFTDKRAQDAVGAILADTATIDLAYTAGTSITATLKDLADSGTGAALVKLTRDAKGRISGTEAATTTDLTEGDNLYFTDERAQDAAGAALDGTGDVPLTYDDAGNKIGAALSVGVLDSLARADSALQPDDMPPGYIDGLKMVWVSGTALTVTSGSAYIPGASAILQAPADIAKTGLSLTASTWYHIYLFDNAGTPDIEIVTTAPAAPYNGTARAKTGDASRRYVGSVKTDASGNAFNFLHDARASSVYYQTSVFGAPFQVANGSASAAANVSCSAVVPVTGLTALMTYANNDSAITVLLGNSIAPPSSSSIAFLSQVGKSAAVEGELPLDGSQAFQYMFFSTPTANFVARVKGYGFER